MPPSTPKATTIPRHGPGIYAGNACVASRNVYRAGTPESTVVRLVGTYWSPPPPGMLFSVLSRVGPDTYVDVSVYNDFASVVNAIARSQEDPRLLESFMPVMLHSDLWLGILRDLPPRFTPPWATLQGGGGGPYRSRTTTGGASSAHVFGPEQSPADSLRATASVSPNGGGGGVEGTTISDTSSLSSWLVDSAFASDKAHEYDASERSVSDVPDAQRSGKRHPADAYSREYFHVTHPYSPVQTTVGLEVPAQQQQPPRIISAIVVKCTDPEPLRYSLRTGLPNSSTADFTRRMRRSYQHRPYATSPYSAEMAVARMTGQGAVYSALTGLTSSRAAAAPLWRKTLQIMGATPELTDRDGAGVDALLPPSGRREWPRSVSVAFAGSSTPRRCYADVEGQLGGVVPLAGDSSVVLLHDAERVGVVLSVSTWSKRKAKRHDTPLLLRVATASDVASQTAADRTIVPVVVRVATQLVQDAPVSACLVDAWAAVRGDAVFVAVGFAPTVCEADRTGLCGLLKDRVSDALPTVGRVCVLAEAAAAETA